MSDLSPAQKLTHNIQHYLGSGQSCIPQWSLFKEGWFNFINGEVVPSAKATKRFNKTKVPWDKKIHIVGLKVQNNSNNDSLLVHIKFNGEEQDAVFGGEGWSRWYGSSGLNSKLEKILRCNYETFAQAVLKFAKSIGYHNNLKKSVNINAYIRDHDKVHFTWLKWLLNELDVHKYTFIDKHLFKAVGGVEKFTIETLTKVIEKKQIGMLVPAPILWKHFSSSTNFLAAGYESDPTTDKDSKVTYMKSHYTVHNPGAHVWMANPAYRSGSSDEYDRDEAPTHLPIYYLIEGNMIQIIDGVVTFNPETLKFVETWENMFKDTIKSNVDNWRQSEYSFNYLDTSNDGYGYSADEKDFTISFQMPDRLFTKIRIGGEDKSDLFHIVELAKKLDVADDLYKGLAAVAHPVQMMEIMTLCLKDVIEVVDTLTCKETDARDVLGGILDHIEKHMVTT